MEAYTTWGGDRVPQAVQCVLDSPHEPPGWPESAASPRPPFLFSS